MNTFDMVYAIGIFVPFIMIALYFIYVEAFCS